MRRDDGRYGRGRRLSRHPYPLLRVTNSGEFLSVLEQELHTANSWRLATNHAEHRAVVANYIGDAFNGEDLCVAVYDLDHEEPEPSNILVFATMAHRWFRGDGKETHAISDDDIAYAFRLFLPALRDVCRKVGVRCRVVYPTPEKARPLACGVEQQLTSFVRVANLAVLHPSDWERFYRFVRYCHAHHVSLRERRLCSELVARGVPSKLAIELALCYAHGRGVLAGRFEWVE
jgi:hypothetical protein